MAKIQMKTPLVEMDGDEMTRILWKWIKEILLEPYIDLNTEYYDLGLEYREKTKDKVTFDSAEATKKYGVAVKCATITPNAARMPEYNLTEMWKSPNGTIRAILDGTVFRTPILVKGITPYIPTWTSPITIARHAYGDVYKNTEMQVKGGGKAELVFTDKNGNETRQTIHEFDGDGIIQGLHNIDKSIEGFASHAVTTLLIQSRTYGLLQRILFPKSTTTDLKISSRKYLTQNIRKNLKRQVLNISIPSLTTQLQELSVQTAATSGHAKIMTATLCQIWSQQHSEVLQ